MNPVLIIAITAAVLLVFVIVVYNDLVSLKARIKASIQEIGNQLKRQAELIPNLEESAKGYLRHEKDLFKLITEARKSVASAVESTDITQMAAAGEKVASLLPRLQAVFESTPQIKGADVVTRLMDELRDTSDKVMYSRRTLIDLSADYNIKLATFPTNLVAKLFGFQKEAGMETPDSGSHIRVSPEETKTHKVKLS